EAGDAHADQRERTGFGGNDLEAVVGNGVTAVGADAGRASRVAAEEPASVLHGAHPILVGAAADYWGIENALAEVVQLSSGCCRGAAVVKEQALPEVRAGDGQRATGERPGRHTNRNGSGSEGEAAQSRSGRAARS